MVTVYERCVKIVKHSNVKDIRTTIGSNGILIDKKIAERMRETGVMAVAISLDGVDAPTHDASRGIDGAFEQTLVGIEAYKNTGLPFQLNIVI